MFSLTLPIDDVLWLAVGSMFNWSSTCPCTHTHAGTYMNMYIFRFANEMKSKERTLPIVIFVFLHVLRPVGQYDPRMLVIIGVGHWVVQSTRTAVIKV